MNQANLKFRFHGAYGSEAKARAKERSVPGAWIKQVTFRKKRGKNKQGKEQIRWAVISER